MPATEAMRAALDTALARALEGFEALRSCDQLTAGASQETFRVLVATDAGEREFALRRAQPGLASESVPGQVPLAAEARLLRLAADAGIPVPRVVRVRELSTR